VRVESGGLLAQGAASEECHQYQRCAKHEVGVCAGCQLLCAGASVPIGALESALCHREDQFLLSPNIRPLSLSLPWCVQFTGLAWTLSQLISQGRRGRFVLPFDLGAPFLPATKWASQPLLGENVRPWLCRVACRPWLLFLCLFYCILLSAGKEPAARRKEQGEESLAYAYYRIRGLGFSLASPHWLGFSFWPHRIARRRRWAVASRSQGEE
jgi:hypothetical protein